MYYLLKSRGVKVLYLGANVPVKDVEYVAQLKKPEFLYTHLTSVAHNFNFERFLSHISSRVSSTPLIVSGLLTQQYKKKVPNNISFKKSLADVMEYITTL